MYGNTGVGKSTYLESLITGDSGENFENNECMQEPHACKYYEHGGWRQTCCLLH